MVWSCLAEYGSEVYGKESGKVLCGGDVLGELVFGLVWNFRKSGSDWHDAVLVSLGRVW